MTSAVADDVGDVRGKRSWSKELKLGTETSKAGKS
jgi:hypothetical protein